MEWIEGKNSDGNIARLYSKARLYSLPAAYQYLFVCFMFLHLPVCSNMCTTYVTVHVLIKGQLELRLWSTI